MLCACRFLFVIQFYIANGFYVAIDFHGGQGQIETDRQIVANPTLFQENWLGLLRALQALPTYQENIRGMYSYARIELDTEICIAFQSMPVSISIKVFVGVSSLQYANIGEMHPKAYLHRFNTRLGFNLFCRNFCMAVITYFVKS